MLLITPQWLLNTPEEELTDQQLKEKEEFEQKAAELKAEQDKLNAPTFSPPLVINLARRYRKSLEVEAKKLRSEVNEYVPVGKSY